MIYGVTRFHDCLIAACKLKCVTSCTHVYPRCDEKLPLYSGASEGCWIPLQIQGGQQGPLNMENNTL